MKSKTTILGSIALLWPFFLQAADPGRRAEVPVAPLANWETHAKAGDNVAISGDSKTIAVNYDVKVDSTRLVGHKTHTEGTFDVLLKKPLKLSKEDARIYFDAVVSGSATPNIAIRPLIEDGEGEKLSYVANAVPAVWKRPKGGGWVSWKTQEFYSTEAGGAAQDIFASESDTGNAWPDGELRFLGFQVRVYANADKNKAGQQAGKLVLANIATGGERVKEQPFLYLDSLVSDKGEYRLAYQTRAEFQGKPVFEGNEKITFDPVDPSSSQQRFVFPIGELQNSWIRYRVTDASGKVVAENERRWDQDIAPAKAEAIKPVDQTKAPTVGCVRFNPARPQGTESVYKAEEPFKATLRVFPPSAEPVRLEWTLRQYVFKTELGKGEQTITVGSKPYTDITLNLPKEENRDAYKLVYRVLDKSGKAIDEGEYILGVAHKSIAPYGNKTGLLTDRNEIKKYPYFRTTFLDENLKKENEADAVQLFRDMARQSFQFAQHMTYMIDAAELEILPGVYDFALVDKIMDAAADQGLPLTIRLCHTERDAPYRWAPFTVPRNFDGASLNGHVGYGSYASTDPRYVEMWHRSFKALHDRYKNHPGFEGYYVMQAGGEWPLPDEPYAGNIADYSWSAKAAFRTYLKENLKFDLAALNARWKTSYKSWDEVEPPQPTLLKGGAPDLRPQWLDFNGAKCEWKDSWFELIGRRIRSYDQNHVAIAYGGKKQDLNRFYGYYDYLHNGGNDELEDEGFLLEGWDKYKLGYITEPHHPHFWAAPQDPAQRGWILDWSVYVMTAQAGGGGQNLHVYYAPWRSLKDPFSLEAHYGTIATYDRFETYKPILRELHNFQLIRPKAQVAVLQDRATLMAKHRTTFSVRLDDLRRWFKLLLADSVDYEFYEPKHEADYKLAVVNPLDEVMTDESIEAVKRMANNGATICISARSGRYSMSGGESNEYALLKTLGISTPKGTYDIAQKGIVAKLEPGQKLIQNRDAIPFFTQADWREEIRKPETGAKFWSWSYRWIPQTDYFGFYANNKGVEGEVIARFPDGGAALTRHKAGKGNVLVFWGTAAMVPEQMKGVMASIAQDAGVVKPGGNRPIPLMLEGKREDINRYYALVYQEKSGTYKQPISCLPDGDWFVEDLVTARRFGYISAQEARNEGLKLTFETEQSPLKVLRFTNRKEMSRAPWAVKFGKAGETPQAQ